MISPLVVLWVSLIMGVAGLWMLAYVFIKAVER